MVAAILAAVLGASMAQASAPVAVIAVVDKVVFSPNEATPTSVQVWGTFVVRLDTGGDREYGLPQYGYFAYKAPAGKENDCLKDWNEMRKFAGTGKFLSWGESHYRPYRADDLNRPPEDYDLAYGLAKLADNSTFEPVKRLKTIPAPVLPSGGSEVPGGKVTLTVRNVRDKGHDCRYVFTLQSGDNVEKSEPVEAGKEQTSWTPKMEIKPGKGYSWTVQAINDKHDTRPATSSFRGK
jgi:hypothetical protein